MSKNKGKLIVIDGTDGSGKATQVAKLKERLTSEEYQVCSLDFPRYYDNFFGGFIGECLAGKHGNWAELDPKIASVVYAADRFESSAQIRTWLEEGSTQLHLPSCNKVQELHFWMAHLVNL